MTTTPDFRAELARLVDLYYALGGNWSPHGYTDTWNDALANARAALATPPPLAPNYIDPEHHGEDRELLQVFYAACNAEGGTADEIHLRGIKAVMAGRATLEATPPPKPPNWREPMTQPNFRALCAELVDELNYHADEHSVDKLIDRARAALATSPPEPPTIMEILTLIDEIDEARLGQIDLVRAALERWGQR